MRIVGKYGDETEYSVCDAVVRSLDGSDYDRGNLEEMKAGIDNAHKVIGILVETLVGAKLMDAEQLREILDYRFRVEE